MHDIRRTWPWLLIVVMLAGGPAMAQSGPALLIEPWPDEAKVQARPTLQHWQTHAKDADAGVRLTLFEDASRYRLDPADDRSPAIGYRAFFMNIRSDDPALPERLVDLSIDTGLILHDQPDWTVSLSLAGGFAGTRPFADSRAWYGRAALLSFHTLDETSQLMLALDYHGNRTIFPDVPLPGIAYIRQLNEAWSITLGLPFSSVRWQPSEQWEINVRYNLLTDVDADVQYRLNEQWAIFAAFENQRRGFHQRGDDRNRRLFFQQRRAEAGLRWQVADAVELTAAGGYTFGGKLERGFDVRDTDTVRRFGDAPYVRAGVSASF